MIEILIVFIIWGIVCFMIGYDKGIGNGIAFMTKYIKQVCNGEQMIKISMLMSKDIKELNGKTGE